jgi:hypothetical protein
MGFAGTGSNADHSVIMMCQGLVIDISSIHSDMDRVIVVINKSP